jgi:hypothetical protein
VQVDGAGTGIRVDTNYIRARFGEIRDPKFGLDDHEVAIKNLVRDRSKRRDDQRADGDVGHETTVHHVDVDPLRAGFVRGFDLGFGFC